MRIVFIRITAFITTLTVFYSCINDNIDRPIQEENTVTIISRMTPKYQVHYLFQDSVGKTDFDTLGPYSYHDNFGFKYIDSNHQNQTWKPEPNQDDTLVLSLNSNYLELSIPNPFLSYPQTFLLQKGDTVVFTYEDQIPIGNITNRTHSDLALNYDRERLRFLYNDKYSPFHLMARTLIAMDPTKSLEQLTWEQFDLSRKAFENELNYIDSLLQIGVLGLREADYRKSIIKTIHFQNANLPSIKERLINEKYDFEKDPNISLYYYLENADSLFSFRHFRIYLNQIVSYNLPLNQVNYFGEAGGSFIDYRMQIDSILADTSLNDKIKKFLLPLSYKGVIDHYGLNDQKEALQKLKAFGGLEFVEAIKKRFELPDQFSSNLGLVDINSDSTSLEKFIASQKGNVILINFWASWCKPCLRNIEELNKLKNDMSKEKMTFVDIAIYDNLKVWEKTVLEHELDLSTNYYAYNSKFSYKLEELNVVTVPHYIILGKNGKILLPYAGKDYQTLKRQLNSVLVQNL